MVEDGITDKNDPVVKEMVRRYLSPIKNEGADVLILGCTHYPHLKETIGEFMGDGVTLISSGAEAARYALNTLTGQNLLSSRSEPGTVTYYTSDSPELFRDSAEGFMGQKITGDVNRVTIEELIRA